MIKGRFQCYGLSVKAITCPITHMSYKHTLNKSQMGTRIIRGGHLVSYVNFQLLCCTPEAKKILYVKCK